MEPPIIHNTSAAAIFKEMGNITISKPDNLTIITAHNYSHVPLFELSLKRVGINDYVVLRGDKRWRDSNKIPMMLKYLESGLCKTEYILFCDAKDVVITGSLHGPIELIERRSCDLLFMSTSFKGEMKAFPELKKQADEYNMGTNSYLNSGVYIGRPSFIEEVFREALKYVTKKDLISRKDVYPASRKRIKKILPDFPKGCGCDQIILRYIHSKFYPRMLIDYNNELAYRNE